MNGQPTPATRTSVRRAAVYVRVSTDEQAALEFNSLQAQEQICRTYISMRDGDPGIPERWTHSDTYSDPGYSGGTLERPALRRLLADVEAGRVDTIMIYKIDRLSRSIHQFYRIWEVLQRHGVDLVSATQDLNTSTSQGKLMLNMLLSFGQFEREQISERTRDKVAAARKRGRWTGGMPILGYDVDPKGGRLVVNEDEAVLVREIFRLYLETPSLTKVVEELNRRGWRRKSWTRRDGTLREGSTFDKEGLLRLLRNPLYCGRVHHRGVLHPGEHPAIMDEATWSRIQAHLTRNGTAGYQGERENQGALLKGLLHCAQCGCRMTPTYTTKGNRRFRYYVCASRLRKGAHACPDGTVSAHDVERQVVERIRGIGRDPGLIAETVRQARAQLQERRALLHAERRQQTRDLGHAKTALKRLASKATGNGHIAAVEEITARIQKIEARLAAVAREVAAAGVLEVDENLVSRALATFGPVWDSLWPTERMRILGLLLEGVRYDGREKRVEIRFRTDGIGALADETA